MRLVADASSLVAELLRARGGALLRHPDMQWSASEEVTSEVRYEIIGRTAALARQQGLAPEAGLILARQALTLFGSAVEIIPRSLYRPFEAAARARLVDESDWSSVALALAVDAGIWADDRDFCGIGLPVWHTRVLLVHLGLAR